MQFTTSKLAVLAAFFSMAYAHMEVLEPAPFRGKQNPNTDNKDFDMTSPLSPDGSNFPCKGYHVDFGTPAGAPTATYPAGSQQSLQIAGGAPHNGGSCQISLSFDGGQTFKVIKSILGSCPLGPETQGFTVPAETAAGDAILSWTWFNKVGNREMYQNCIPITITGSGTSRLDDRPDMFVANVGNGCTVTEGIDVQFPDPGTDVETKNAAALGAPTGNCGASGPSPPPQEPSDPAPEDPAPVEPTPADPTPADPSPADPVPPTDGSTVTVVDGDFCITIAERTGISLEQLFANNPSINAGCTNLAIGQVLNLRRRSRVMRNVAFSW